MLNKISPILGPEMLATLRMMGHGDQIAIVDGNYPAAAHSERLIRADGLSLIPILDGILDILPIETASDSIVRAVNAESPGEADPIHQDVEAICSKYGYDVTPLSPEPFYERVRSAFAVIATSEPALYANVILTKGVVKPVL
ncbi:MAG: RbsD/FucU domain-containing protein [Pseudomonadota bacterium]|nr:RbsD/FucU domain-containing protein [Pseudomonadota bacterium]